jgi:hypothetical protein
MAAAEALDLPDVVAAAMVTKSTALSRHGRRREAVALLEGSVRLAAETGEVALELRARNNLASVTGGDDPARAWEILREGLDLAEKVGDGQMARYMVSGWAGYAYFAGREWDEALERLDRQLEVDLDEFDRLNTRQTSLFFRAVRGEDVGNEAAQLMAATPVSDSQLAGGNLALKALILAAQGEYGAAADADVATVDVEPGFAWIVCESAGVAALYARDVGRARAAAAALENAHQTGAVSSSVMMGLRACIAALEDRREDAEVGFRDALKRFRELGQLFLVADAGLEFVLAIGPSDPEARAAGEEAREIFARLGARPWVERAEALLAGRERPILEPSAVPEPAPAP